MSGQVPKPCTTSLGVPFRLTILSGHSPSVASSPYVVLSPSLCSPLVRKDIMRNFSRSPAGIQVHRIHYITWGKGSFDLIFLESILASSDLCLLLQILENQSFTICSNILPKFYTKYADQKLETFTANQNYNSLLCGFQSHFHSHAKSHSFSKCL